MSGDDRGLATRSAIEEFLYHEAALLDEWRLEEWLALLTDDATYEVPAPDSPSADCTKSLSLVFDDRERVAARVKQYLANQVVAEAPRSRVRRMVNNVRILDARGDAVTACANLVVYRFREERVDTFVGRYDCLLTRTTDSFKIRKRRITLDAPSLRAAGMLSIIL